jgi:hypothetical protein
MTRPGNERNPLIEAAKLDTKPALMLTGHIGADETGGNFAPIRMRPPDSTDANVRVALNKPISGKPVQI